MGEAHVKRIFERLDGIGERVEHLNGTLSIDSAPGRSIQLRRCAHSAKHRARSLDASLQRSRNSGVIHST